MKDVVEDIKNLRKVRDGVKQNDYSANNRDKDGKIRPDRFDDHTSDTSDNCNANDFV